MRVFFSGARVASYQVRRVSPDLRRLSILLLRSLCFIVNRQRSLCQPRYVILSHQRRLFNRDVSRMQVTNEVRFAEIPGRIRLKLAPAGRKEPQFMRNPGKRFIFRGPILNFQFISAYRTRKFPETKIKRVNPPSNRVRNGKCRK